MVESGIAYPEAPILTFRPCAGGRDSEATCTWAREGTLVTRKKYPAIKPGKGKVRLLPERRLIRHPLRSPFLPRIQRVLKSLPPRTGEG